MFDFLFYNRQAPSLPNLTDNTSLRFTFIPEGNIKLRTPITKGDWAAVLSFAVKDIPRLMRDGLYWTPANIRREESECYLSHNLAPPYIAAGWTCSRHYTIVDLADEPQWIGWLVVVARKTETLAQFRVGDLSPEMAICTDAVNNEGQGIYHCHRWFPEQHYNAIYDDMPMEGWWPWPKKEAPVLTDASNEEKGPLAMEQGESLI